MNFLAQKAVKVFTPGQGYDKVLVDEVTRSLPKDATCMNEESDNDDSDDEASSSDSDDDMHRLTSTCNKVCVSNDVTATPDEKDVDEICNLLSTSSSKINISVNALEMNKLAASCKQFNLTEPTPGKEQLPDSDTLPASSSSDDHSKSGDVRVTINTHNTNTGIKV